MDNALIKTEAHIKIGERDDDILKRGKMNYLGTTLRVQKEGTRYRVTAPREKVMVGVGWRDRSHVFDTLSRDRRAPGENMHGLRIERATPEELAGQAPTSLVGSMPDNEIRDGDQVYVIDGIKCRVAPNPSLEKQGQGSYARHSTSPYTIYAPDDCLFSFRHATKFSFDHIDERTTTDGTTSLKGVFLIDKQAFTERKEFVQVGLMPDGKTRASHNHGVSRYLSWKPEKADLFMVKQVQEPVVQISPKALKLEVPVKPPLFTGSFGKKPLADLNAIQTQIVSKMFNINAQIAHMHIEGPEMAFDGHYLVQRTTKGVIQTASRVAPSDFENLINEGLIAEGKNGLHSLTPKGSEWAKESGV